MEYCSEFTVFVCILNPKIITTKKAVISIFAQFCLVISIKVFNRLAQTLSAICGFMMEMKWEKNPG